MNARSRVLSGLVAGLVVSCTLALAQPLAATASFEDDYSDAEPVDPAEFRIATMPPVRPQLRAGASWTLLGPAPTQSAQVAVPPDNRVSGAIQAIAAHPTDPNILYIGAVNGGIWKTGNATAGNPTWTALTENLQSQSIASLAFDPTDPASNTLVAGIGRLSNFAQRGDDEIGVYRTTDGGGSWTLLGGTTLLGQKLLGVAARGSILLAASSSGGLFRSVNTGANWTPVSGTGGLPTGPIADLAADPGDNARFYISVRGSAPKLLRSADTGATWTDVTAGITPLGSSTGTVRIAVGSGGVVFVAVVNAGELAGVFRSTNQGGTWTAMDIPAIHPGAQGTVNTSIAADPGNANRVYIGGDRITASPYTGNVVRGDASLAAGTQFTSIVGANAGGTSPHADSRALAFDASGNLLESDDGGIYRRSSPTSSAGTWGSVIGNLNVTEVHDLGHDRVSNIITIGTQDNGMHMQQTAASNIWLFINGGDGGDVAVDDLTQLPTASFRFLSSQNLGGFRRAKYNAANILTANTSLPSIADPQFVTPLEINIDNAARLLIGGTNTLYEINNANAASPTLTTIGGPGANRNAMAYGAVGAPEAAYVGKGSAVYRRSGASFVATTALPAGAATITDVAMDPANPDLVFAIDDNQVFRSNNAGTTWQDVTGNLLGISGADFRSIEYISRSGSDLLAIGTRSGVFQTTPTSNNWGLLASGMPDVLVFDLRYVASQNRLIAGTLGRGVWSLDLAAIDLIFRDGFQ